jgi:hypothetical protein
MLRNMDTTNSLICEWRWARRKLRELLHHACALNAIEYAGLAKLREDVR